MRFAYYALRATRREGILLGQDICILRRFATERRRQYARLLGLALPQSREVIMHSKFVAVASAMALMLTGTVALAQSGTSERTPGHIMQRTPQAKSTGPGASEYAPGHLKRKSHSNSASGLTPSHRTTPGTTGMRTR